MTATASADPVSSPSPVDWVLPQSGRAGRPAASEPRPRSATRADRFANALTAAIEGWEACGRDPAGDSTWRRHARCAGADLDEFYPEASDNGDIAVTVCIECPSVKECLAAGLLGNEWGVWGGTSRRSRTDIMSYARGRIKACPDDRQAVEFVDAYKDAVSQRRHAQQGQRCGRVLNDETGVRCDRPLGHEGRCQHRARYRPQKTDTAAEAA